MVFYGLRSSDFNSALEDFNFGGAKHLGGNAESDNGYGDF